MNIDEILIFETETRFFVLFLGHFETETIVSSNPGPKPKFYQYIALFSIFRCFGSFSTCNWDGILARL